MSEDFSSDGVAGLTEDPSLPADIHDQLLILTIDHPSTGATLITDAYFQGAMQEGFQAFTGEPPSPEVQPSIGQLIKEVNAKSSDLLRIPGIEALITKGFLSIAFKMKWGVLEVQEQGNGALRSVAGKEGPQQKPAVAGQGAAGTKPTWRRTAKGFGSWSGSRPG